MMYGGHGYGIVGMICGAALLVLLLVGVVALIAWAVRASGRHPNVQITRGETIPPAAENRALQIAQERYARGEITKEQYEDIRQTLVS